MRRAAIGLTAIMASLSLAFVFAGPEESGTGATYRVDHTHSSVIFAIKHMNVANFYGRFNEIEGTFTDAGDKSEFEIRVPTASIDTNSEGRDKHLKSPEFFNVEQYPEMTFKSTRIRMGGEKWEVDGDLTMLGKMKPIRATITRTGAGKGMRCEERCGYEAKFAIKRSEFGMTVTEGLGDDVRLVVSLEGVKQ